jgi:hypothetical protein
VTGRDREYDRFGPWALEISDEDPAPPLFERHLARAHEALISIKIPRKIARRDAHPGMDLYDFVISLYEEDLVILERVASEVRSRTIAYRDVKHLRVREDLLRGRLFLGVPGSPYELPYNTVSNEVMARVSDIIRARYRDSASEPAVALPTTAEPAELSFYFERMLKEQRRQGSDQQVLAAQPDLGLGDLETSAMRKVLFGIVDKRLLESAHLSDGHELRVIDRGRPFAYRWQTTYGRRETLIPLANISEVRWDDADKRSATLTVATAGGENSWAFARDTDTEAYRSWLSARAARRG